MKRRVVRDACTLGFSASSMTKARREGLENGHWLNGESSITITRPSVTINRMDEICNSVIRALFASKTQNLYSHKALHRESLGKDHR